MYWNFETSWGFAYVFAEAYYHLEHNATISHRMYFWLFCPHYFWNPIFFFKWFSFFVYTIMWPRTKTRMLNKFLYFPFPVCFNFAFSGWHHRWCGGLSCSGRDPEGEGSLQDLHHGYSWLTVCRGTKTNRGVCYWWGKIMCGCLIRKFNLNYFL